MVFRYFRFDLFVVIHRGIFIEVRKNTPDIITLFVDEVRFSKQHSDVF